MAADWRALLGFEPRDQPDFDAVHARYRQLLRSLPYPLEFKTLRALSDAVQMAELELLTASDE